MPKIVRYKNLKPAADLTATTVFDTDPVPCFGARQVVFVVKATNSVAPAACTIQVSGSASAGWLTTSGQGLGVRGAVNGNNLSNGGVPIALCGAVAGGIIAGNMLIDQAYARCELTGHASSTITGVSIDAFVVYDDDVAIVDFATAQPALPSRN